MIHDSRIYHPAQPITPVTSPSPKPSAAITNQKSNVVSFQQLLQNEVTGVKFSGHALSRLQNRNIQLNQDDLSNLRNAMEKAAEKGSKESLILLNPQLAFVVSVPNKTVITAMDGASLKENVFTNIDSAVIV